MAGARRRDWRHLGLTGADRLWTWGTHLQIPTLGVGARYPRRASGGPRQLGGNGNPNVTPLHRTQVATDPNLARELPSWGRRGHESFDRARSIIRHRISAIGAGVHTTGWAWLGDERRRDQHVQREGGEHTQDRARPGDPLSSTAGPGSLGTLRPPTTWMHQPKGRQEASPFAWWRTWPGVQRRVAEPTLDDAREGRGRESRAGPRSRWRRPPRSRRRLGSPRRPRVGRRSAAR